jgi:hypothetical protein
VTGTLTAAAVNTGGNVSIGGNLGIGQPSPGFPLTFANTLGDKFSLWTTGAASYGFGIQSSLLQIHTDVSAADIAFGYGSSGAFTEKMRIKGNGRVGIGTSTPEQTLHVNGLEVLSTGSSAGFKFRDRDSTSSANDWVWYANAGVAHFWNPSPFGGNMINVMSNGNVGIGSTGSAAKLAVETSGAYGLIVSTGTPGGNVAEFGANGDFIIANSTNVSGRFRVLENARVEINNPTSAPLNTADTKLIVNGAIRAYMPPTIPTVFTTVCWEVPTQILFQCGLTSSIRYKTNVETLTGSLDLVARLRPVTFNWKGNGTADLGFIAEEVEKAEPLLTIKNPKGEIDGVRYDRIGVVAINAIKEQQAQIEAQTKRIDEQQKTIADQQRQIDELRKLVCAANVSAGPCKEK